MPLLFKESIWLISETVNVILPIQGIEQQLRDGRVTAKDSAGIKEIQEYGAACLRLLFLN